ncbi:isopenicillin-N N-acyltransferase [Coniochaeta ligniaria NRRL 30616]|uniref:Isopenicillin-N N-acyltransferase n=1 Tax=Coniochaeta ligniaria NRRL 30616 TaxID=1408157 RepID=A0A1J7ITS9_9PEZI|nr:isopenicillin-N N-acyltransferase [Coniochaeta ligniaria NRRL 30616]
MTMKRLTLRGSPREIGAQYGAAAREEILFSIDSYKDIFHQTAGTTWDQSCQSALRWLPVLREKCPDIVEEMEALAAAAGVDFPSILALNLRSEIALTHYSDGCTAIGQSYEGKTFIAQNWDWMDSQSRALLGLEVRPSGGKPAFFILAEAGIVGKYGFNDRGVGVCLNALRCGACSTDKLPIHVALRKVLGCESFAEARRMLDDLGVASAANFLMADRSGACASVEVSPRGNFDILPDGRGIVCHTNHLYSEEATARLKDHPSTNSFTRLERIRALSVGTTPSFEGMRAMLSDRNDGDFSISRSSPPDVEPLDRISTLATIIVDLVGLKAEISLGRPDLDPEVVSVELGP